MDYPINEGDIHTPYLAVREEFHPLFEVRQNETPGQFASVEEKRLRLKLIAEEFLEVAEAFGVELPDVGEILHRIAFAPDTVDDALEVIENLETDVVNLAKELADLEYVTVGTLAVLGIDGDKVFYEVHKSNMTKAHRTEYGWAVVKRDDGKVLKGDEYEPAEPGIHKLVTDG